MKLLFKTLSMLFVMVGVLTYGTYLMTGRIPWQGLDFKNKPQLQLPDALSELTPATSKQIFYKWQDSGGVWHFSNEPAADGVAYEQFEIDPNTNIIAGISLQPEEVESEPAHDEPPHETPNDSGGFPYSPERVKKLMDDAKNVQKTLNERANTQQEILDQL